MARPAPIAPEQLLAHSGWMRALARSLIGDASAADDIVQESMLAALRRPPDADRPVEAWLSRVVRHVAANFRRGEQRRSDRHAGIEAQEPPDDPGATLERLDTQQMIVELVRELDEPSRSTLVLRYFEGLSSQEIGRRMGVNDGTVRWRLQKALDELRARLERKHGSREAWCAVLAPLAHSMETQVAVAAAGGVVAGAGVMTMGLMSKLAAALLAVSMLSAGAWFVRKQPEAALALEEPAGAAAASAQVQPELALPAKQARASVPELVAPADASGAQQVTPADAGGAAGASGEQGVRLRARFVDVNGQPWSRVWFRDGLDAEPSVESGADGRAELVFAAEERGEWNLRVAASREGCATRSMRVAVANGQVVDLGEIVLDAGCRVAGRVHAQGGEPLAGVTVGLSVVDCGDVPGTAGAQPGRLRRHGSPQFDRLIVTRSDARGAFDLRGVPAGRWRVWGTAEQRGYGISESFELQLGEELLDVDLEVPELLATDTVKGRVIDPHGAPIPKAIVAYHDDIGHESSSSTQSADEQGHFEFRMHHEVACLLVASDPDGRWSEAALGNVAPGTHDAVLQLLEPRMARVRVRGPASEPVRGAKFQSLTGDGGSSTVHELKASELEPGLYECRAPGMEFALQVEAPGYLDGSLQGLDPAALPAELDLGLAAAPVLRGRVSAGGTPLAGAVIEAKPAIAPGNRMSFNDFPCLMEPRSSMRATTAADGTFTLTLQTDKPVYLRSTAPGWAAVLSGPLDASRSAQPLEIELALGGAIEGRVRAKDGTTLAGAIVGITAGDGHPRTMRSGHDGVFRFEGLMPGPWLVLARDAEFRTDVTTVSSSQGDGTIHWSCEVLAGRTTFHDLHLDR